MHIKGDKSNFSLYESVAYMNDSAVKCTRLERERKRERERERERERGGERGERERG